MRIVDINIAYTDENNTNVLMKYFLKEIISNC